MIHYVLSAALAILMLLISPVAQAQQMRDDTVTLDLSLEKWIETDSATVTVVADLAVKAGGLGMARAAMQADLTKISAKAPWRLVGNDRLRDEAGFERWRITAEARLPSTALGGIGSIVDELGEAGRSYTLLGIDFTPTLAEREVARAALRADIYQRAADELARLNAVYPTRDYRVAEIHTSPNAMVRPKPAIMRRAETAPTFSADTAGSDNVAEKVMLRASIRFAARVHSSD